MEEVFKELPKMKHYYICKLCICNHGIKNDFIIQTNNKKQLTKLLIKNSWQHQKSFLHSESIKRSYKKEEEKDKEYSKHVNDTYKQIEKYSKKYL
jgi:hypothetical protein